MPTTPAPSSTAHITVQVRFLDHALQRTTNVAGRVSAATSADAFTARAAARAPRSLLWRMNTFAAYGAVPLHPVELLIGNGRQVPGPSDLPGGHFPGGLPAMWRLGMRWDAAAHVARRAYNLERFAVQLDHHESVGAVGIFLDDAVVCTAVTSGGFGSALGAAAGAVQWAAAWSAGRRESFWEDVTRDADEGAALVGFAMALGAGAGAGVLRLAVLQGVRLLLATAQGVLAGGCALGGAAWHGALCVCYPAATRPPPAAAAGDLEAPLLPAPTSA